MTTKKYNANCSPFRAVSLLLWKSVKLTTCLTCLEGMGGEWDKKRLIILPKGMRTTKTWQIFFRTKNRNSFILAKVTLDRFWTRMDLVMWSGRDKGFIFKNILVMLAVQCYKYRYSYCMSRKWPSRKNIQYTCIRK